MATLPGADISQTSITAAPQAQTGQENNPSDPMVGTADEPQNSGGLTEEEQSRLIALVRRYKDQWSQDLMILMQRCLLNLEFFKGNQFISFGPGTSSFYDAAGWMNQNEPNSDDKDLYQYCNNFYQMLATGFVAALAPQVPKSRWLPENAEHLTDVTTAKAAQTLIDIIERQNREQSLLKQQLLYLYTTGAVFRHTRYIVDADRAGTSHEPILQETQTQITPDRLHCFHCGADNETNLMGNRECQSCGSGLGDESFFPAEFGPTVQKIGEEELPNGMVAQNVYCPLELDVDPAASNLRQTPILNLEVEIHLGALRAAYPEMYVQSITVDAVPSGTVASDFIMVAGVAATSPVFLYGIPYFHNTSTTGTYLGIARTQNYVVANGVAAGGAPLSLPMLRAALSRVEQSLGTSALKTQVWHAHPSQIQAYEEMGFAKQEILMNDGKMPGFDGLTADVQNFRIAGREVVRNIHADNTRIDFMEFGSWLKVVWGKAPFWFKNRSGQWVFQIYDPSSGNPTANEGCYYVDCRQYAVDNPQAISSVTGLKVPVYN